MKKSTAFLSRPFLGAFILLISFFVNQLYAQDPGELDPEFGDNGVVILDVPFSGNGIALTIQTDEKILLAGQSGDDGNVSNAALFRFHADGSVDNSFGVNGIVTSNLNGWEVFGAVRLQKDGKIVAVGGTIGTVDGDFLLARYHADGSVDDSFGTDGIVITDVNGNDFSYKDMMAIQPDGKILAVGYSNAFSGNDDIALLRYNSDGSLDETFGENGIVITDQNGVERGFALALSPNGKMMVTGGTDKAKIALLRYNPDGSLDDSFGNGGIITTDITELPEYGKSIALQTDGKILVTGHSEFLPHNDRMVLLRYNEDGSLDTYFGEDGIVIIALGLHTVGTNVILQPDNKIIVTGYTNYSNDRDMVLARFHPDGSPDNSFGPLGTGITTLDFGNWDFAFSSAMQADGRILVSGKGGEINNTDIILARYFSGLTVVEVEELINNGLQGISVYPNPAGQQAILEYNLDEGSEIQLNLLSRDGRYLTTLLSGTKNQGLQKEVLHFPPNLSSGTYLLYLKASSGSGIVKFHYTGE